MWFRRRPKEEPDDPELAELLALQAAEAERIAAPPPREEPAAPPRHERPPSEDERAALPIFRYHPDPIATGSVVRGPDACSACGEARGFVYDGPVFGAEHDDEPICPWCIADGSAAERFHAEFTDSDGLEDVPREVLDEVTRRTPGFSGRQQEHWLVHCGDAAAFLGRAGADDLPPDAVESLREDVEDGLDEYVASLDAEGSPTAYVFRCLHCGRHLAYSDTD